MSSARFSVSSTIQGRSPSQPSIRGCWHLHPSPTIWQIKDLPALQEGQLKDMPALRVVVGKTLNYAEYLMCTAEVSYYPLHFMLYRVNLDCFSDSAPCLDNCEQLFTSIFKISFSRLKFLVFKIQHKKYLILYTVFVFG